MWVSLRSLKGENQTIYQWEIPTEPTRPTTSVGMLCAIKQEDVRDVSTFSVLIGPSEISSDPHPIHFCNEMVERLHKFAQVQST